jgi:phospholipid/cholesterol/gamma-HCH transport system ATP-binding protein
VIRFEDVHFSYDPFEPVLEGVSFSVEAGERISLIGPGGCGKSTVLRLLCGLSLPVSGQIELFGNDTTHISEKERNKLLKSVGVAFQQGGLFDFMTVDENIKFAMSNMTDFSAQQQDETVDNLLNEVKLGRTKHMFPYELSGGMQRRVGIARAICTDPVVSIFDEPTAGLDPVTSTIILDMIKKLSGKTEDAASICCTSNVEIGIRFADRVLVLNQGKIVADGPWRELLLTGSDWVRHFLSTRFIGLDLEYARELDLPTAFIEKHWKNT